MTKSLTEKDKWIVAIICGLLFLVIAAPFFYNIANGTTSAFGLKIANNGCPNLAGLVIGAALYMLILRFLISKTPNGTHYSSTNKWICSGIGGLLFFLLSSPFAFELTNSLTAAAGFVGSCKGCPNSTGLVVNTIIFILVIRLLIN
jgi:hypothetical protein